MLWEERNNRVVTSGIPEHPAQLFAVITTGVPVFDVRCAGQVCCNSWSHREELLRDWDFQRSGYVRGLKACAFCARVSFGATASTQNYKNFRKIWPPPELAEPPAAFSNVLLEPYMRNDTLEGVRWYACHACCTAQGRGIRQPHVGMFEPDYITNLLAARPTDPLMLSVVQCNVRFGARVAGFLHTQDTASPYLLRGPLVYWAGLPAVSSVEELPPNVRCADVAHFVTCIGDVTCFLVQMFRFVLEHNLRENPLLQKYKTAVETTPGGHGVPILNSSVISGILAMSRARGPTMPDGNSMPSAQNSADDGQVLQLLVLQSRMHPWH
jgi:hypothetical protein